MLCLLRQSSAGDSHQETGRKGNYCSVRHGSSFGTGEPRLISGRAPTVASSDCLLLECREEHLPADAFTTQGRSDAVVSGGLKDFGPDRWPGNRAMARRPRMASQAAPRVAGQQWCRAGRNRGPAPFQCDSIVRPQPCFGRRSNSNGPHAVHPQRSDPDTSRVCPGWHAPLPGKQKR